MDLECFGSWAVPDSSFVLHVMRGRQEITSESNHKWKETDVFKCFVFDTKNESKLLQGFSSTCMGEDEEIVTMESKAFRVITADEDIPIVASSTSMLLGSELSGLWESQSKNDTTITAEFTFGTIGANLTMKNYSSDRPQTYNLEPRRIAICKLNYLQYNYKYYVYHFLEGNML